MCRVKIKSINSFILLFRGPSKKSFLFKRNFKFQFSNFFQYAGIPFMVFRELYMELNFR